MNNLFLITISALAVLAASCSKEAKSSKQTTNNDSQMVDATTEQTVANYNKIDSGYSQSQTSVFRNARKRLPSRSK